MGKSKYSESWEGRIDQNGRKFGLWLKRGENEGFAYCLYCKKEFRIDGSGISQVIHHASGSKHTSISKDKNVSAKGTILGIMQGGPAILYAPLQTQRYCGLFKHARRIILFEIMNL